MDKQTCVLVFTRDLRLSDNRTLWAALDNYEVVIPLFVLDDKLLSGVHSSTNRIAYLFECLEDLKTNLRSKSSDLFFRRGLWPDEVIRFAKDVEASGIVWSKDMSSYSIKRDKKLQEYCDANFLNTHCIDNHTIVAPQKLSPKSTVTPREFKVFTPYYNSWIEADFGSILPEPENIGIPAGLVKKFGAGEIANTQILPDDGISPNREIGGEKLARKRLNKWVRDHLESYEDNHNDLEGDKTSHTSSALHFGTLSAREVAVKIKRKPGSTPFIRQLCWRDFYHQILFYNPHASQQDYVDRHDTWNVDDVAFQKWCTGETGYPIVDAAMRQLKQEGFMHNRARMIVASFLTKDLYIDWKLGADWFMKWLTDGDIANNYLNWQWVAGTGTDTNPNRIFNPIRQSERFDPHGVYIKRYVPELKNVDEKDIHFPHHLREQLEGNNLLGNYPEPMVDHSEAITRYKFIKQHKV